MRPDKSLKSGRFLVGPIGARDANAPSATADEALIETGTRLDRCFAALARTDSHGLFDRRDEDLAVTDAASLG